MAGPRKYVYKQELSTHSEIMQRSYKFPLIQFQDGFDGRFYKSFLTSSINLKHIKVKSKTDHLSQLHLTINEICRVANVQQLTSAQFYYDEHD